MSLDNLITGVDIDDVLYKTSIMLKEMGTAYLIKNKISFVYNPNGYIFEDLFSISPNIIKDITNNLESACDWASIKYIDAQAVIALQNIQKKYNAKLYIITARNEKLTYDLLRILYNQYNFQVQNVFTSVSNKAAIANNNNCDIMLDDYTKNIMEFEDSIHCKPILVSTDYIKHNKDFAKTFNNVLDDWNNLEKIIDSTLGGKLYEC